MNKENNLFIGGFYIIMMAAETFFSRHHDYAISLFAKIMLILVEENNIT